ncbi:hypothetical protein [Actinomycetospora soli]|uniref:hypothetical protein n=1 Tax=Actinomycetospora soli TaxID=2893887 RepID=UPI001E448957|nr:hypothetical protein [Actinomycetospora soli]MCD2189256.1 hypothetical protein [Actinomycetospora soli]
MRRLLLVLAVALAAAGCSTAPAPAPDPSSTADPTGTRVLTPARGLFTVEVPSRFADVVPGSPEATAVPALAEALQRGVGVLAIDRRQGYSPTAGGYCTLVGAQDLPQLADEARQALLSTGTPQGTPEFTVLPATGPAGPRVAGTYRTVSNGRTLTVQQVSGLAGPGRACLVTASTDDPVRDAAFLTTARDTFRMAG